MRSDESREMSMERALPRHPNVPFSLSMEEVSTVGSPSNALLVRSFFIGRWRCDACSSGIRIPSRSASSRPAAPPPVLLPGEHLPGDLPPHVNGMGTAAFDSRDSSINHCDKPRNPHIMMETISRKTIVPKYRIYDLLNRHWGPQTTV